MFLQLDLSSDGRRASLSFSNVCWWYRPIAWQRGVSRERFVSEPLLQLFLYSLLLVSQHFIMLSAPRSCILMSDPHFIGHTHTHTHGRNFEVHARAHRGGGGGWKAATFHCFLMKFGLKSSSRVEQVRAGDEQGTSKASLQTKSSEAFTLSFIQPNPYVKAWTELHGTNCFWFYRIFWHFKHPVVWI